MTTFLRPALLLTALAVLLPAGSHAAVRDTLADPATLLSVDGRAYPTRLMDIMFRAALDARRDITWTQFVDEVAENQLMAKQAVAEMGRDKLMAADRVGFAPEIVLQDQYLSLVRRHFFKQIDATVRSLPGGNLDNVITRKLPRDDANLKELMTLRDRGEVKLTPAQADLAKKTVLAVARMPDGSTQDVTYHDLMQRENVQGRTRLLQEKDYAYLDTRVQTRIEGLFILWWMDKHSGMSAQDQALLRTMLEEKHLRENHMLLLGVVSAMHEDLTPALEKMQKTVTKQEVAAWYAKNKEEFRQVEKVRARHIRCASEADCNAAAAAVAKGMDFSAAARQFSIAPSKGATPAGSLGWVLRETKNMPWVHQYALIQPKGVVSAPARAPEDANGRADWEVVLVDERIEGYSPPESETVRYLAVQEIARKKLIEQYIRTRDALEAKADIRRNGKLLAEREAILARMPRPKAPPPQDDHGHGHGHGHGHAH